MPLFVLYFILGALVSGPEGTLNTSPNADTVYAVRDESADETVFEDNIGTISDIKGDVTAIAADGGASRLLTDGDPVYANETIETGSGASVQIELLDESLFTVSENSSVTIDSFVYDPAEGGGEFSGYVAKGVFRFITGLIAEETPENVNLEFPSGVLGIRGTVVVGEVDGEEVLVSLEDQGDGSTQHRIVVGNWVGEKFEQVEITKPGFATVIKGRGQKPAQAFNLPPERKERFQQHLRKPVFLPRDNQGRPQHIKKPRQHVLRAANNMKQTLNNIPAGQNGRQQQPFKAQNNRQQPGNQNFERFKDRGDKPDFQNRTEQRKEIMKDRFQNQDGKPGVNQKEFFDNKHERKDMRENQQPGQQNQFQHHKENKQQPLKQHVQENVKHKTQNVQQHKINQNNPVNKPAQNKNQPQPVNRQPQQQRS